MLIYLRESPLTSIVYVYPLVQLRANANEPGGLIERSQLRAIFAAVNYCSSMLTLRTLARPIHQIRKHDILNGEHTTSLQQLQRVIPRLPFIITVSRQLIPA